MAIEITSIISPCISKEKSNVICIWIACSFFEQASSVFINPFQFKSVYVTSQDENTNANVFFNYIIISIIIKAKLPWS